jgi:hypothetical protein
MIRDGILGHQFHKRLESFALCYSQSFLLADFKENQTLLWFTQYLQKNSRKKIESIHEKHFVEEKHEGRKPNKNSSRRRLEFMDRNID